jgi:microcystin-dependent protein
MPYIGEIMMFAGNFEPKGWAFCNGQLLAIAENQALFLRISTYYGGDGETTFALPDLRGGAPIHWGQGPGLSEFRIGQSGGAAAVPLAVEEIGPHTHAANANSSPGVEMEPVLANWAASSSRDRQYGLGTEIPDTAMAVDAIAPSGDGKPHENMAPFLTVNYLIALHGIA